MSYYVKATVRDDACDSSSPIKSLVLESTYLGYGVHAVGELKSLADQGRLLVRGGPYASDARIRIFWSSWYKRWVATTRADDQQCNNLLSLPIFFESGREVGTINFKSCSLR